MKDQINNIRLSFSCNENWNSFATKDNQKFCEKCKHVVHDFTNASQQEFEWARRNSHGRLCGRFRKSQMNNELLRYAASVIAASTIASASCTSESVEPPALQEQQIPPIEEVVEDVEVGFMGIVFEFPPDSVGNDND